MGTRGKTSTAGLAVKVVPTLRQRLPVPDGLTVAQAATWRQVIASRPVDWFDGGSAPLLVAYCRAVETQAVLAKAIAGFDVETLPTPEGSATLRRLLTMQDVQTKQAILLATAMRLSQHARRSADAGATAAREGQTHAKLWDVDRG